MSMIEFYENDEVAREAMTEALKMKEHFVKELELLDSMIFLLKYYLATGEGLDPEVFGIQNPEEEDDDE